jgi:hypothetical protein
VFGAAVTDVTVIGGQTLVSLADGRMLEVNGSGGGGCNMFAIQNDASCGFATVPGYAYYAGSQVFDAAVYHVNPVGGVTFIGEVGKMLKVNGAGGSGCDMLQVVETASAFSGLPGSATYVGDQAAYLYPTCSDGIQNQGETGVDCGGPCAPCATCSDGIQNQGETGVDCGGPCAPCATCSDVGRMCGLAGQLPCCNVDQCFGYPNPSCH